MKVGSEDSARCRFRFRMRRIPVHAAQHTMADEVAVALPPLTDRGETGAAPLGRHAVLLTQKALNPSA